MNEIINNIIIIGTSHISPESIKEVKELILNNKPKIVALELDRQRFYSLMKNEKSSLHPSLIKQIGLGGYFFLILGRIVEKTLAKKIGTKPGVDMKSAALAAKKVNAQIALIDQDIRITLREISKNFKFWYVFRDLFRSIFNKKLRKKLNFDISKVPGDDVLEKILIQTKDLYPGLYKVLIEDRNKFMAKRLFLLSKKDPDCLIVAVVGAGHKKEIRNIIEKYIREN